MIFREEGFLNGSFKSVYQKIGNSTFRSLKFTNAAGIHEFLAHVFGRHDMLIHFLFQMLRIYIY